MLTALSPERCGARLPHFAAPAPHRLSQYLASGLQVLGERDIRWEARFPDHVRVDQEPFDRVPDERDVSALVGYTGFPASRQSQLVPCARDDRGLVDAERAGQDLSAKDGGPYHGRNCDSGCDRRDGGTVAATLYMTEPIVRWLLRSRHDGARPRRVTVPRPDLDFPIPDDERPTQRPAVGIGSNRAAGERVDRMLGQHRLAAEEGVLRRLRHVDVSFGA
jgi:hypothetical protein